MDHEDSDGAIDWTCVGCGEDLRQAGIYQRCDTIVDYDIVFTLSSFADEEGDTAHFGDSDVCDDCEENCKFHCRACREEITMEQEDALAKMLT